MLPFSQNSPAYDRSILAKYPFDLINLIKGRPGRAAAEHRHLLKAMKTGDKKAVLSSVREHIEAGWHELQKQLADEIAQSAPKVRKSKGAAVD